MGALGRNIGWVAAFLFGGQVLGVHIVSGQSTLTPLDPAPPTTEAAEAEPANPGEFQPPSNVRPVPGEAREAAPSQMQLLPEPPGESVAGPSPGEPDPAAPSEPLPQPPGEQPADASLRPEPLQQTRFHGIEPGKSTREELINGWGQPQEATRDGALEFLQYQIDPFPKVEVTVEENRVVAVLIFLQQPLAPIEAARQLKLTGVRRAAIEGPDGRIIGQAFPERGALLSFAQESGEPVVAQIVLEAIHAEPFLLRARQDRQRRYEANLADLATATRLDPQNDAAWGLKAQILMQAGRYSEALQCVETALELAPGGAEHLITRAHLLEKAGHLDAARETLGPVLADENLPPHIRAAAELRLGDLLASGPKRDYKQAMEHHLQSIRLATAAVEHRSAWIRRTAKQTLVEAHLSVATDIAWGNWQRKQRVVPKWLIRAEQFADDLVENESASPVVRLLVKSRALVAQAGAAQEFDPGPGAEELLQQGQVCLQGADDPLLEGQVHWLLADGLVYAVHAHHARGAHAPALKLAESAIEHLDHVPEGSESTPAQIFAVGRLLFLAGSVYAVQKQDHPHAVRWFDKALPLLDRPLPQALAHDRGRVGEWMVSMGISYWHTEQRDKAVALTEQGAKWMEEAVREGTLPKDALSIPYGNLSNMQQALGNEDAASRYARLASHLEVVQP